MALRKLSISRKVTLIIVLFSLFLLAAIGVSLYLIGESNQRTSIESELLSTAIEKEAALNNWLEETKFDLSVIAGMPQVKEDISVFISTKDPVLVGQRSERLIAAMNTMIVSGGKFSSLEILDFQTGEVLISTKAEDIGKSRNSQMYFQFGQTSAYIQSAYLADGMTKPIMTVSQPLISKEGKTKAIIAGHMDMDRISEIITRRSGTRRSDDAFLVNDSHLYVTQPRLLSDPAVMQKKVYTEAVNRCLGGNSSSINALDYRNIPASIVYRYIPTRKLCLIVKIDQAEALAPINDLARSILIVMGAAFLIGLVVSTRLGNAITRPIRKIAAGVQEIGAGNLDYRFTDLPQDETGQLGTAINSMAAGLQQLETERIYHQKLLETLAEAAEEVHLADDAQGVYRALDEEVNRLGNQVYILELSRDGTELFLPYFNLHPDAIQFIESATGEPLANYREKFSKDGVISELIKSEATTFLDDASQLLSEVIAMPDPNIVQGIINVLHITSGIVAPLHSQGKISGFLAFTGKNLTSADIPAVTTFANQTSIALENVKLMAELKKRADALLKAHDELEMRVQERTRELRQSEDTLRTTLDAIPEAAYLVDDQGKILSANITFARRFNVELEDVIGQNIDKIFPVEIVSIRKKQFDKVKKSALPLVFEDSVFKRDIENSVNPVVENGHVTRLAVLGIDVTEKKRAAEAIRQSQERFQTLFENSPIGINVAKDGVNLFSNTAYTKMFGFTSQEELRGKPTFDQIPLQYREEIMDRNVRRRRGEIVPNEYETYGIRKDGSVFPMHVAATQINLVDGQATVAFFIDITDIKKAEQALARKSEDLQRSNDELERFAYVASHDLQEPLRMVTSYLQLIERRYRDKLDPEGIEFIDYAVDGSNRMKRLINDLLTYSRVGTKGKEFIPVECNKIMDNVLGSLKISIQEAGANVVVHPLPVVQADGMQMEMLFQNLIGNALKFRGTQPPIVEVKADRKEDHWEFAISDNGIGIESKYLEKIFVLFQRLHTSQEYPGTGIGLAISKRIVERHGGKIWVESKPGEGTSFFFTIPVREQKP